MAGMLVARTLHQAGAELRLPHWVIVAAGWALSWTALSFLTDVLSRATLLAGIAANRRGAEAAAAIAAGIICGAAGGAVTGMVLRQAQPKVGARIIGKIAAGWAFAFVVAQTLAPVLAGALPAVLAAAMFWGLIALVGNALMLRFLGAME
jgi:hypothetical protein